MLKTTRQGFDDKKCVATSISWTKFYWKPCQQNVKGYFSLNSEPLVGGSRVIFFHYGGQEDGRTISQKKTKQTFIRVIPAKCLFLLHNSDSPPSPLLLMKSKVQNVLPRLAILKQFITMKAYCKWRGNLLASALTKILKTFLLTRPVWKNLTTFHNCQVDQINTENSLELLRVV